MYLFRKVFTFYSSHLSERPHGEKEWETVRQQHLEITFPVNEMQRCQPDRALLTQVGVKYSSSFNKWENVLFLATGVIFYWMRLSSVGKIPWLACLEAETSVRVITAQPRTRKGKGLHWRGRGRRGEVELLREAGKLVLPSEIHPSSSLTHPGESY